MSIYDDLKILSDSVLSDFDQKGIVLISKSEVEGSSDEPLLFEKEYPLRGVVKGSSFSFQKNTFSTGSIMEVTTNVLKDVRPKVDDDLKIGEDVYKIIEFNPVPPTGVECVWKFKIKRGI